MSFFRCLQWATKPNLFPKHFYTNSVGGLHRPNKFTKFPGNLTAQDDIFTKWRKEQWSDINPQSFLILNKPLSMLKISFILQIRSTSLNVFSKFIVIYTLHFPKKASASKCRGWHYPTTSGSTPPTHPLVPISHSPPFQICGKGSQFYTIYIPNPFTNF